jgi:hypothetical protein
MKHDLKAQILQRLWQLHSMSEKNSLIEDGYFTFAERSNIEELISEVQNIIPEVG